MNVKTMKTVLKSTTISALYCYRDVHGRMMEYRRRMVVKLDHSESLTSWNNCDRVVDACERFVQGGKFQHLIEYTPVSQF
ncbi:hypothetical protein [Rhodococcus sp. ACS1]|uniref:hypothetical protein n=1 Tax=Rhodococcus sp. ACS1 TaxID=2028570 RepID=UPI00117A06C6|nr:hypothetical protein [Rhodococcus sp. ACS1]